MMIRTHLDSEKEELIENDPHFLRHNVDLKNYAIKPAILEKRLIFDNSSISTKLSSHTLSDLQ